MTTTADVLGGRAAWSCEAADALSWLRGLPADCVHCCVTSPPYFGLRDYGVSGQLGLEATPAEYVERMVAVFREVRRVLHPSGTLFLNLGDSYSATGKSGGGKQGEQWKGAGAKTAGPRGGAWSPAPAGYKPKDLLGIPWRVAFALQADGWYLRSDIIWAKPNPMPESVTDRPGKAHEYVFLLAKGRWSRRTIKFADLPEKFFHLGKNIGLETANVGPNDYCVRLAASIYHGTQREENFGLPPFYAEEWKHLADGVGGDLTAGLPPKHRAAAYAARLLSGNITPKDFLRQLNGLRRDLAQADHLLKGWVLPSLYSPSVCVDREGAITVHDAGKVCKFDFAHDQIVVSTPLTCNYFFDMQAVAVPAARAGEVAGGTKYVATGDKFTRNSPSLAGVVGETRNLRTVWTVSLKPFKGAHFAVMPKALVEPCVKAGASERGVCPQCGEPWKRKTKRTRKPTRPGRDTKIPGGAVELKLDRTAGNRNGAGASTLASVVGNRDPQRHCTLVETVGWQPGCECGADPVPAVVMDPFAGSGTVAAVAVGLGRRFVGCDLNAQYLPLVAARMATVTPPAPQPEAA